MISAEVHWRQKNEMIKMLKKSSISENSCKMYIHLEVVGYEN